MSDGCEHEWDFLSGDYPGATCRMCALVVSDDDLRIGVETAKRERWKQGIEQRLLALEEHIKKAWPW